MTEWSKQYGDSTISLNDSGKFVVTNADGEKARKSYDTFALAMDYCDAKEKQKEKHEKAKVSIPAIAYGRDSLFDKELHWIEVKITGIHSGNGSVLLSPNIQSVRSYSPDIYFAFPVVNELNRLLAETDDRRSRIMGARDKFHAIGESKGRGLEIDHPAAVARLISDYEAAKRLADTPAEDLIAAEKAIEV